MFDPIRSRRQEVLLAYADALEADLRRASRLVAGKSFFDRAEFYQPLKALPYRPRAEDVMREGQVPLDREAGSLEARSWSEREEKRREEKEKPVPMVDILKQKGGVILGDPGAGKSELLRWAVFERLKTFRKSLMCGDTEGLEVPILVRIPLMGALRETKLRAFHQQVLGRADRPDENELHRLAVLKALHDFAVSREGDMPPPVASTLVRELSRDWQNGRIRPFVALDGWDEVTGEANRRQLRKWLDPLIRREGAFVTSRIVGYEPLELVGGKQEWRLLPLVLEEAENLVQAHLGRTEQSDALCRELRQKPQVATLASNPLALALMVRVFGQRNPVELPRTKSALYREVLHDLLGESEARRKGQSVRLWEESREAKLEFLETLAWFGYPQVDRSLADFRTAAERLWRGGRFPLDLKDALEEHKGNGIQRLLNALRHDHGLLVPYGKGAYALVHKALLDYLAAAYLARRINEHGFDVEIKVPEDGKVFRVTARHYLDRKIWSPKHREMIALLGGLVEDTEGLLGVLWKDKEDDFFRNRLLVVVSVNTESLGFAVEVGSISEDVFNRGWSLLGSTNNRLQTETQNSLLTDICMIVGRLRRETQEMWIADVLMLLEASEDGKIYRNCLAEALGSVDAGLDSKIRSRFVEKLLERLEAREDGGLERRYFAEALGTVGTRLDARRRSCLVKRLLGCLGAKGDGGKKRMYFADALGRVGAVLDIGSRNSLVDSLLKRLGTEENRVVRARIAIALGRIGTRLDGGRRAVLVDHLLEQLEAEVHDYIVGGELAEALRRIGNLLDSGSRSDLVDRLMVRLDAQKGEIERMHFSHFVGWVGTILESFGRVCLVDRLLGLLEAEKKASVRGYLAKSVGKIGSKLSAEARDGLVDRLLVCLEEEKEGFVRGFLSEALLECTVWGDEGIIGGSDRLLERFEAEQDEYARRKLAEALKEIGIGMNAGAHSGPVEWLQERLEVEEDGIVKSHFIEALVRVSFELDLQGRACLVDHLMARLEARRDLFTRMAFVEVLGRVGTGLDCDERATLLDWLLFRLKAKEEGIIRGNFFEALGRVGAGSNAEDHANLLDWLLARLEANEDRGVQAYIAVALERIGIGLHAEGRTSLADWLLQRLDAKEGGDMRKLFLPTLISVLTGKARLENPNPQLVVFRAPSLAFDSPRWRIVPENELTSLEGSANGSVYGRKSNVTVREL